ncbi:hypothetical protein WI74_28585 [Burkholderia ubonensis]|nr:hypothetical protein WI74_28585 [Burkholderia ubonensis]
MDSNKSELLLVVNARPVPESVLSETWALELDVLLILAALSDKARPLELEIVAPVIDALLLLSINAVPLVAVTAPPLILTAEPLLAVMALVAPPGVTFNVAPSLSVQLSTGEPALTSAEAPGPLKSPAMTTDT